MALSRAFLQFDGVDSAFYCWLNGSLVRGWTVVRTGKRDPAGTGVVVWFNPPRCFLWGPQVGFSKDSRLPAEFEVSHLIRTGSNLLAVQVR